MGRSSAYLGLAGVVAMAGLIVACGGPSDEPTALSAPPPPAVERLAVERGARLYAENCQSCHGDRDGKGGIPDAPIHNDTGHTWHHPDAQLRDWVLNGKFGFSRMPPQKDKLSGEQIAQILDYIKTWWAPEQRAIQEDVSKRYQESLERLK